MKQVPVQITSANLRDVVYTSKNCGDLRIPTSILPWQDDCTGIGCVIAGVKDLFAGKVKSAGFIVCDHPTTEGGLVREVIRLALSKNMKTPDKQPVVRLFGEESDPDGAGSESLVDSCYPHSIPRIVATIVQMARQHTIFRLHQFYLENP